MQVARICGSEDFFQNKINVSTKAYAFPENEAARLNCGSAFINCGMSSRLQLRPTNIIFRENISCIQHINFS